MTERIADAADRHAAELTRALQAYTGTTSGTDRPDTPDADPVHRLDHELRERLCAAAVYTGLPPQILLPAQFSHDSPHRRG